MPKSRCKPRNKNGQGTFFYSKSKSKFVKQITVEDENGDKKRKTFYGNTPEECEDKEKKYIESLNKVKSIPADKRKVTLIDILLDHNEDKYRSNIIRESTYCRHKKTIEEIERDAAFSTKPIHAVKDYEIKQYLYTLPIKSESMIKKIWQQLKKGFGLAVDSGIIHANPFLKESFQKPKSLKRIKKVIAFTPKEVEILKEEFRNFQPQKNRTDYSCQLMLQLLEGLRIGEVNALTEDDIDFEEGYININKTIASGSESKPYLSPIPKTSKGARKVPIFNEAIPYLKKAINNKGQNKYGLLFFNYEMNTFQLPTNSYNSLKRICLRHGIHYQGQHMLRHTFATMAVKKGVPPQILKEWLGHESIVTTMDTYYNNQQDTIDKAIEIMNN